MISGLVLLLGLGLVSPAQDASGHCLKALAAAAVDDAALSGDFSRVECPRPAPAAAFRYDRAQGASRVSRTIAKGEVVPMFPEFGGEEVRPGQQLFLVVLIGANRIERRVEALQAARPGERLFVRSESGQVFAARYEVAP
jgi:hypothetical protein